MGLVAPPNVAAYTPSGSARVNYAPSLAALELVTATPGDVSCSQATSSWRTRSSRSQNVRRPRASRSWRRARATGQGVWIGETGDPELSRVETEGKSDNITALGLASAMHIDPRTDAYTSNTLHQMAVNQLTGR